MVQPIASNNTCSTISRHAVLSSMALATLPFVLAISLSLVTPATAVPTGRFIDGMPMGLQVAGPYLEDRTPIRFAQLVENELGSYRFPREME